MPAPQQVCAWQHRPPAGQPSASQRQARDPSGANWILPLDFDTGQEGDSQSQCGPTEASLRAHPPTGPAPRKPSPDLCPCCRSFHPAPRVLCHSVHFCHLQPQKLDCYHGAQAKRQEPGPGTQARTHGDGMQATGRVHGAILAPRVPPLPAQHKRTDGLRPARLRFCAHALSCLPGGPRVCTPFVN